MAFPEDVTAPVRLAFVVTVPAVRPAAVPVMLVPTRAEGVPRAGVTRVGEVDNTVFPVPVLVVTPVPPLATASVPARVMVPAAVMGPPDVVSPVVPPETSTEVTVPEPPPNVCQVAVVEEVATRACPLVGAVAPDTLTVVVADFSPSAAVA